MIPNYIIPSEHEMLEVLSKNTGVAVTWDINAQSFLEKDQLQLIWKSDQMPITSVYLLSAKNANFSSAASLIQDALQEVLA
jgi:hypothetical protein